jgi:hypothetical protein
MSVLINESMAEIKAGSRGPLNNPRQLARYAIADNLFRAAAFQLIKPSRARHGSAITPAEPLLLQLHKLCTEQ